MACVHDPRSDHVRDIDAGRIIKGGSAATTVVGIRRQGGGDRFPNE